MHEAEDDVIRSLRAELLGMKPSALRKRAVAAGVESARLDEADDSEDLVVVWSSNTRELCAPSSPDASGNSE